ncbi:MAG: Ig-like domain-containing protein [Vicingaceae bacterium]|nr:Ig-like domain-containing protein [Vicingaceae bacterium]
MSCSKDEDNIDPTINIVSPVNYQKISGGETIEIAGIIKDDRNIERITVTLRDKKNTPVLRTITKTPATSNSKSYNLSVDFDFNDLQMASGEYFFNVTVSDGINTTTKYVPILFEEVEKERQGVFVLSNSGNFSNIYMLDDSYNGSFYTGINGDFIGGAIDPTNQQLVNVGATVGAISARELSLGGELWSVLVPGNPPTPYYTGFYYNDQNIYLGKRNGGLQGYDKNGNPNYSTGTSTGYFMESAFIHNEEYVVMEEKPIVVNNVTRISLTWLYSGVRIHQTVTNSDIKGMYSLSSLTMALLTNTTSSTVAELIFYDVTTGGKYSPFNISSLGKIDDCLEVGNGVYLVAAGGNLTYVNANNYSTLGYLNGVIADRIWFDELMGELYVANGNQLTIYDYATRAIKGSYIHTEDIQELYFWYNK